jgi:hypothetical protein
MAYKLPFVVTPRLKPIVETVGSDESGKIEIERRGYLTVAEKNFVQGALGGDTALSSMHSLAAKIARKEKKGHAEVMAAFAANEEEYLAPYADEISGVLVAMLAYQEKYKIVAATALCVSRLSAEITVEDVLEFHPDILEGLVGLYEEEDRKSIEKLEAAADATPANKAEQAEGKK